MITGLFFIILLVLLMAVLPTRIKLINKVLFFFILILLTIFAALRDGKLVNDYELYVGAWYWATYKKTTIEASFIVIRDFLRDFLKLNYISIFITYAVLGVVPKMVALKNLSPNFYLGVVVYLCHFYILHELTQMRAGVAAGFILLSIVPLYNRNLKHFLFFIALACAFHYSAIMMLPLWFLKSNSKIKFLYFSIPLGLVLYGAGFNLIGEIPIPYFQIKLNGYRELRDAGIDDMDKINVFNAFYIIKVLLFYLFLVNSKKIAEHNKYFYLLIRIEGLSLFALPALSVIPVIAYRVNELLGIVEIVLIPLLIYIFRFKVIGYLSVIIIALSFLLVNIFYNRLILP